MSFGRNELYTLLNVSSITDLLSDSPYLYMGSTKPPELPMNAKTINCYRVAPADSRLHYMQTTWSISCRAGTEGEAQEIADEVFSVLVAQATDDFFMPIMLGPIPPQDENIDNFNVPVEVDTRRRTF